MIAKFCHVGVVFMLPLVLRSASRVGVGKGWLILNMFKRTFIYNAYLLFLVRQLLTYGLSVNART